MGLRIATNVPSQMVRKNLRKNSNKADASLERLSSGKRITKSADDAAGLAIAKSLEAQSRGLRQASKNSSQGISMIQVAEGGLGEISNIMVRLRELTVQAASDTVGERERGFLNLEYEQLVQEADRIAKTTIFNGSSLLEGDSGQGQMDFHVGAQGGDLNRIQFDADQTNATTDALEIEGTSIAEKDDAVDAMDNIDEAIRNLAGQRAMLGSVQSRLQTTVSNLQTQVSNQENARSVIEDTDYAAETSRLAAANVIKEAGIASLIQADNLPNSALRLIG